MDSTEQSFITLDLDAPCPSSLSCFPCFNPPTTAQYRTVNGLIIWTRCGRSSENIKYITNIVPVQTKTLRGGKKWLLLQELPNIVKSLMMYLQFNKKPPSK